MATELPTLPADPVCPAALAIRGASSAMQGVVCRAMKQDIERDDGTELAMSAGKYGFLQHEAMAGVAMNLKSDPATVTNFCHGPGLPVISDEGRSPHYSCCPVWQAEKERIWAGRDGLVVEQQPESVAMGVSSIDAPDPWAAARAGLDELAPVGAT